MPADLRQPLPDLRDPIISRACACNRSSACSAPFKLPPCTPHSVPCLLLIPPWPADRLTFCRQGSLCPVCPVSTVVIRYAFLCCVSWSPCSIEEKEEMAVVASRRVMVMLPSCAAPTGCVPKDKATVRNMLESANCSCRCVSKDKAIKCFHQENPKFTIEHNGFQWFKNAWMVDHGV